MDSKFDHIYLNTLIEDLSILDIENILSDIANNMIK
jgi:hypothetical protein